MDVNNKDDVVFDSKMGWIATTVTLRPKNGVEAEIVFHRESDSTLYLELRGIRTPSVILELLVGIDDFQVLQPAPEGQFKEHGCLVWRLWRDDDRYETVIDDYEAYESGTEPSAAGYRREAAPQPER